MSATQGAGAEFRVFAFTAADLDIYLFTGRRAGKDARAWFDRLKADPAVQQLFITREVGRAWSVVQRPVRRDANGAWVASRRRVRAV